MILEQLLKLIADEHKGEVEAFFNSLNDKVKTLSDEITQLESDASNNDLQGKLDDAISKRDAAKRQLAIVRDTLGLPVEREITKELVDSYVKDKTKGDDVKDKLIATLRQDIEGLEQTVETHKNDLKSVEDERDKVATEAAFNKVFNKSMPSFEPASAKARVDIENLMREDAVLEDENIVYKNGDSYIRVEGERMTMKTKLGSIQDDPENDYLFKTKASGGSGSPNGAGGGATSRFDQRRRAAGV